MDGWNCCVTGLIHEVGNSEEMAVFRLPVAEQRCDSPGGLQPLKPHRRSPPQESRIAPRSRRIKPEYNRGGVSTTERSLFRRWKTKGSD